MVKKYKSFSFLGLASTLAILFFYSENSLSAVSSTTMAVTAIVLSNCAVVAAPLTFGNYDPTGTINLDATTTIAVTCTLSAPFNIGLDAGTGSGATVDTRKMTRLVGGAQTLDYCLYQDSNHSTVWGNTINTDTLASNGTGILQTFTVYGRVPNNQSTPAPAAAYSDTVTVTLTF
jgi:spore coat protein U-like protein